MQSIPTEKAGKTGRPSLSIQPLSAIEVDDALLLTKTVVAVTGLSVATIYRKIAANEFCQPIRLGTRCTRFRAGDVKAWLAKQTGKV